MTENTMPKAQRLAAMLRSGMAMIPEIDLPESADELERLHAVEQEAERLRAALEDVVRFVEPSAEDAKDMQSIAFAALQSTKEQP